MIELDIVMNWLYRSLNMNMILQDQKPQVPRVWKNPSRSVPLFLLATAVYVDECVDVGSLGEVAE